MTVCHHSPDGAQHSHRIAAGARRLDLRFLVDWGDDDLRGSHEKPLSFCSFACLAGWAQQKAADHDHRTVTEGPQHG